MKKLTLPIILSSCLLFGMFLSINLQAKEKEVEVAKADPATATFTGFAGAWNPATHSGTNERYILTFSEELGENNATNYCEEIGNHFQINGESLKSISTSLRIGHNNQGAKNLFIDIPTAKIVATDEYPVPVFHIDGGTPFQNYLLPELTFSISTSTYTMTRVTYTLAYSSFNNNIDYTSPHPDGVTYSGSTPSNGAMVRIAFNQNVLGNDETGVVDHTSEWGNNVMINGTRLSAVDGAIVGASAHRLYIFVPTAYLTFVNPASATVNSTLYVKSGYFGSCILPDLAFFWSGSAWTGQTDALATATQKTSDPGHIRWNNTDQGNYSGHKGMLLEYNESLALRGAYYNGGLDKVNLVDYYSFDVRTNIKLNGVALKDIDGAEVFYKMNGMLWIYAPGMGAKANVLEIKNVRVMDVYLPDQCYLFNTSWATDSDFIFSDLTDFVDTYMYMDSNTTNQCVTYYAPAKAAYSSLSANEKMVFTDNAKFTAAFNRLAAWATYHNDTFDGSAFIANLNPFMQINNDSDSSTMFNVILIVSLTSLAAVIGFIIVKRKRENN